MTALKTIDEKSKDSYLVSFFWDNEAYGEKILAYIGGGVEIFDLQELCEFDAIEVE